MDEPIEKAIVYIPHTNTAITAVCGTGFVFDRRYVLTCAHVIATAFGQNIKIQQAPATTVNLYFLNSSHPVTATVIGWRPRISCRDVQPKVDEDMALLELHNPLDCEPKMVEYKLNDEIDVESIGFTVDNPQGISWKGRIHSALSNHCIVAETSDRSHYDIEPGFSGAPVWSTQLGGVIGMVIGAHPSKKSGYLIPTTELKKFYNDNIKKAEQTKRYLSLKTTAIVGFLCAIILILLYMRLSKPFIESKVREDSSAAVFVSKNTGWNILVPTVNSGWSFGMAKESCGKRQGRRIRGNTVGFFKTQDVEKFNLFQDFILHINVQFIDSEGMDKRIAWVVRAKDLDDYYLFELVAAENNDGVGQLNFYRYLKGKRDLLQPLKVPFDIGKPCDSFDIYTFAVKNEFQIFIKPIHPIAEPLIEPQSSDNPVRLGIFMDLGSDELSYGGVGFQPCQGGGILLQQMRIMPQHTEEFKEVEKSFPQKSF